MTASHSAYLTLELPKCEDDYVCLRALRGPSPWEEGALSTA